ncbi:MAG: hypothetical protein GWN58_47380 [Anaerolineae bacterium]|nr:hypothetical protein [Anaerolineae bacterium]
MPNGTNGQGGSDASLPTAQLPGPRLYLNGFPKSGLHLLWCWSLAFVEGPAWEKRPWAGTFEGHAWTTQWADTEQLFTRLGLLRPGTYLKAHTGWREDIERKMFDLGLVHIFVYRDPRDVAVSQAYHILAATDNPDETGKALFHPGASAIREMAQDDFDYILAASIAGYGPWAGVIERWELYAGWLDVDWTLSLKYEDMRHKEFEIAQLLIRYVYGRTARVAGYQLGLFQKDLDESTKHLLQVAEKAREHSPTFRKGKTGGWREHFTPDHIELWKQHDPTNWVERLGYEW